jgi:hypothetical protein
MYNRKFSLPEFYNENMISDHKIPDMLSNEI